MGTKLKRPEGPQRPSVPEAPVTAHGTQGKLFIRNQVVVSFGEYARGFIATLRHSRKFPGSRYNSWGPTEASPRLRPRGHLVPLRAVKRGERESASPPRAVTAPSAVPAVTAHGAPAPPTTQARLSAAHLCGRRVTHRAVVQEPPEPPTCWRTFAVVKTLNSVVSLLKVLKYKVRCRNQKNMS